MYPQNIQNIIDQIDQYINQYAVNAFQDQRLRTILLQIMQVISALSGNVNTNIGSAPIVITSALFIDATNCPLTALAGKQLAINWNDQNRFLAQGTEWTPLSGGGFQILIPGFDSADANYTFYVFS